MSKQRNPEEDHQNRHIDLSLINYQNIFNRGSNFLIYFNNNNNYYLPAYFKIMFYLMKILFLIINL